ncbi:serine/threonine-protein kinase [Catelliglobosispora koreensis]|uniref:serine/threonine-protein kinase n=1 Tax=Catelliglobosispora koreensis TaxID=129052 RepID=UPI0003AAC315
MSPTPKRPSSLPEIPGLTEFSLLAVGGYATIFRARQAAVGREVAIKVENFKLESERDRARFVREAHATGKMSSHPHVVDLFDAGVTADNHPYLVMELCAGSYQDLMPLRPQVVRDIGVKIADALADAHERGIVHRDVKPANILVSLFGEPALADFGLAILAEQRDPHITLDVMTPAYAPPEAFRRAEPAPPGDVYGLCATLYALLTGAPPRWQKNQPPGLLALIELFTEPIPEVDGCPEELIAVLRLGMTNDPAKRPTARALEELLVNVDLNGGGRPVHGPVPDDGPPTQHIKQRGPVLTFLDHLFKRR